MCKYSQCLASLSTLLLAASGCGSDSNESDEGRVRNDASVILDAGSPELGSDGGRDLGSPQPDTPLAVDGGLDGTPRFPEAGPGFDNRSYDQGEAPGSHLDGGSAEVGQAEVGQAEVGGVDASSVEASGHFVATGSMAIPRSYHTATALPDGRVLVAGGIQANFSGASASAELYDPSTGRFSSTGSMKAARKGHQATLLDNGKVLVAGAESQGAIELYDPAAGTFFSAGTCPLVFQDRFAMTKLDDGTVLIAGGAAISTGGVAHKRPQPCTLRAALYDPAAGSCTCVGPLGTPSGETTATRLADGSVLVVGYGSYATPPTFAAQIYDPITRSFSPTGPSPSAIQSATATLLANGTVLLVGRTSSSSDPPVLLFDPTAKTFAALRADGPHYHHTSTLLTDGRVLIAGGGTGASDTGTPTSTLFDPATQTFTPLGWWDYQPFDGSVQWMPIGILMQAGRINHTATLLPTGQVLLVGGQEQVSLYQSSAELYVP